MKSLAVFIVNSIISSGLEMNDFYKSRPHLIHKDHIAPFHFSQDVTSRQNHSLLPFSKNRKMYVKKKEKTENSVSMWNDKAILPANSNLIRSGRKRKDLQSKRHSQ